MILKNIDSKDASIADLEHIRATVPSTLRAKIEQEIRALRAGIKGEQESAYLIDFDYGKSKNSLVIHDLRLEIDGRVAQIDHLIINRVLDVLVLETKHFHAGLKITDDGEFLRWNDFRKSYEGMASPIAQNERHIQVLNGAFGQVEMPTRLGVRLVPTFYSYILVSPNTRIDRPKKFDSSSVIKADVLRRTWEKNIENTSMIGVLGGLAKVVSTDTVTEIGRQLVALHKPARINYAGRFGVGANPDSVQPLKQISQANPSSPLIDIAANAEKGAVCRACGSGDLTVQHGKYGYYFKCSSCGGNSPIKIGCGVGGHKERLRKEGHKFFRECPECGTSCLFFANPS